MAETPRQTASDTSARRKLTTLDKLKIVVGQARCPRCNEKLGDLADLEFDHSFPLALGGADDLDNLRAIHADCHRRKTSGGPATTHGSDIHAIAKTRRLAKDAEAFRAKVLARMPGQKREPKGTLRSRGFDKSKKRRFGS